MFCFVLNTFLFWFWYDAMFIWSSEEYCSRSFLGSGPSFLLNNFFYLTIVEEMVERQHSFDYFLPSLQVCEAPQNCGLFSHLYGLSWVWVNEDYSALIPFTVTSLPELDHRLRNQNMNCDTIFLGYPNLWKVLKAQKCCLYNPYILQEDSIMHELQNENEFIEFLCLLLFFVCRSSSVFRLALGPVAFPLIL